MDLSFRAPTLEWRGPPPYLFARMPEEAADAIAAIAREASYGWGCIPVTARIGDTEFTTALLPKDGGYLVPVKAAVQRAEHVELGDEVEVALHVDGV